MPLDARKIVHIHDLRTRMMLARMHTVVLVRQTIEEYSYEAVNVIIRPRLSTDPQYPAPEGVASRPKWDTTIIAPLDIDLTNVVCIADTNTATSEAVAGSIKYEIVDSLPLGIAPGGTRIFAKLRHLR